eukprot:TRINITY_DN34108_c0_g1_i1.p1 TRINITY_DN34108_c0_g1~~TRINITY_DN34108_c0_g1_i1.p1  ORF type:complete len:676 (+),score=129.19 TRINITY_DN34108_c0_g1_i1:34-2061(+)
MARKSVEPVKADLRVHGNKGAYVGGKWHDLEECAEHYNITNGSGKGKCGNSCATCPRSRTRHSAAKADGSYDVVIIGAGCIGSAIARELSKSELSVLMLDSADDVTQGATKGNSGIVHAGYDDAPGSVRAKFCWKGNQMFPQLDRELHFGYNQNGSLVVATSDEEIKVLHDLMKRGDVNGVKNLSIINQEELREREPHVHPNAKAALLSPDAGTVIPYEFAIALAENAADNGVEVRVRHEVKSIKRTDLGYDLEVDQWDTAAYMKTQKGYVFESMLIAVVVAGMGAAAMHMYGDADMLFPTAGGLFALTLVVIQVLRILQNKTVPLTKDTGNSGINVCSKVNEMAKGGSGYSTAVNGSVTQKHVIKTRYIVNCAGSGGSDIARMINDKSFTITPRLGEYVLLHKSEGHLANHTIFPAPDPKKGKGVLVQATLWGNLILGPTARDVSDGQSEKDTVDDINRYILSKCKALVPSFDAAKTIHAFCGARAKSDRKDWIIEPSAADERGRFIHAAGIDSPGLAGSPAIALHVVELLQKNGLVLKPDQSFNPNRAPIVFPKEGWKGLKASKRGTTSFPDARKNVVCKCELVTEAEVVEAIHRSLPVDSTQAIRKRTRAGMGHCQAEPCNYDCEGRVAELIARETGLPASAVGRRPWPGTSTLKRRWITEQDKQDLQKLSC